jgi:hypothetical protein
MLSIFLIAYTILSLLNLQLTTSPLWEIDYWGGIFSLILYAYLIITWGSRINEKRIRMHSLLPLKEDHLAALRFSIAVLPYINIIFYLVLVHLIIIDQWHAETGSILGQIGITLILFAGFIRGRDDWFSHWNLGRRFSSTFVTVLIIQVILVFVFTTKPGFNRYLVDTFSPDAFNYASLIFPALGFAILITTIFSFKKRRSYLQ